LSNRAFARPFRELQAWGDQKAISVVPDLEKDRSL